MGNLWYNKPASEWEEALPIGCGRIGGMIYGGIDRDVIQVNEETMWYGKPANRINPDAKPQMENIRSLLKNGKVIEAERLMELALSGCPDSMHPYQTLGELQFFFDDFSISGNRKNGNMGRIQFVEGAENYKRELDLETAVATVTFGCDNTVYKKEIFASHPADGIVMRFSCEGEGTLGFMVKLRREKMFDGVKKVSDNGIALYGNLGRGGYEFSMQLRACAKDGTVQVIGENLCVRNTTEVLLYFTADTSYYYRNIVSDTLPEAQYQEQMQVLLDEKLEERWNRVKEKGFDALYQEHVADYQALYHRVCFTLKGSEDFEAVPTDHRLENMKLDQKDIGLSKLLFDFGRYLTIASSREEGLPTTLQGIWNKDLLPPWDSKYTININTEMNYWPVESCNLSECHMPLLRHIEKMQKSGRKTAFEMYGCRGFVAHHNTDIHGDTAPQDLWYPGSYWPMGGAWLCTHLWKHYAYRKDTAFLMHALPIMLEAALFFVDFLTEHNGYLVTNPSVSPENSYYLPDGKVATCCIGATMDNQILRDLFTGCLKGWKELTEEQKACIKVEGIDDAAGLVQEIETCLNRLMPDRIGSDGRIMEWMEEYREVEPGHRHISHLYGLYPGEQITVDTTPELAAAARKTLEYRLANGGGHTGWSRAWIMNHYAYLWDGAKAYENIEQMLMKSTYPNMFDKHPPFQIDGNFGATAAISSMLVQSSEERVVLLPALPEAWPEGAVTGLRLVGNAEIALKWEAGKLTCAELKADSDYKTCMKYQGKEILVALKAGETMQLPVGRED